ncbi:MAG: restriction endonuclease subunit R [Cyanothece sp. SIO1E1]|nr:restriction endonuclease subunit R [Cyanothece sp. SIO1E1]
MTILKASKLTLAEVERLLNLQAQYDGSFADNLLLERLTEAEQQELTQIRDDFWPYLRGKKALEGQVRLITLAPLLRLAGFYRSPIQIRVEEDIERIYIENEDQIITGQFDIIAVNKTSSSAMDADFWVLVIETKRSELNAFEGLPQLLTYAYRSLVDRGMVWGLATNGMHYQFVRLQKGNPATYQYMPMLNLFESESAVALLQVLKAICQL